MNIKVLTYNIHHAEGVDNEVDLGRIAHVLAASAAELIALQEVDRFMPRTGFVPQAKRLAQKLGKTYVFAPTLRLVCLPLFGNAVISAYPIISWTNHRLPGTGEPRRMLETRILMQGETVCFCNTHLGLNAVDRKGQVAEIIRIVSDIKIPLILCGDFNALPDAPEIRDLLIVLDDACVINGYTFPPQEPTARIDYIFTSSHWKVRKCFTINSQASDHLPIVAHLTLDL
ncbi:MAG: endonuclease/exonuclease/phosphatase family protein [Peptococcaceae bacterium]|nr:endonuclease/exonuclease/phosphatase family protein [Peptococcaceae bacterium]